MACPISAKIFANLGMTKVNRMIIETAAGQGQNGRIDQDGNKIVLHLLGGLKILAEPCEDDIQNPSCLAGLGHVDVELRKDGRIRGEGFGEGSSCLDLFQKIPDHLPETLLLRQFRQDLKAPVQRKAGIEERGEFLGKNQQIFRRDPFKVGGDRKS